MTREKILAVAKPILFNTEMVRAILDGRKTQTRRVIKPQYVESNGGSKIPLEEFIGNRCSKENFADFASYQPGDCLWVRETWQYACETDGNDNFIEDTGRYIYYADDAMPFSGWTDDETGEYQGYIPWCPSIHMPKEAARLFLRVTGVRVERLQEISEADGKNEGVEPNTLELHFDGSAPTFRYAKDFATIWDATIKPADITQYGWDANPWVWVYEFERVETE